MYLKSAEAILHPELKFRGLPYERKTLHSAGVRSVMLYRSEAWLVKEKNMTRL